MPGESEKIVEMKVDKLGLMNGGIASINLYDTRAVKIEKSSDEYFYHDPVEEF
jgi:hypothetical protein